MSFNRGGNGKPRGFGFSGFQLKKEKDNQLPPPPSSAISKHGYSTMSAISQNALSATFVLPKKRSKTEEEYFDEDDEQSAPAPLLEYIPAPGSPSYQVSKTESSDSEEDPLDAFMADIEKQVQRETIKEMGKGEKGIRGDIEEEDMEESYYRYMEENPLAGVQNDDSDPEIEYDEDGNPIAPKRSKEMDPLAPIDHSEIKYSDFEKNFYTEHEEIMCLSAEQIEELRQKLGIKVTGLQPPNPVCSFVHFGFDETLMKAIRKANYTQPTPIQAQAIPAALGGRDIIGIARTGSGKTAAFLWPMLVHIMDQKELQPGDGPIGLILAPTRELSQQIYTEAKKFGKVYNIQVVCCYGGGSKWEQSRALEDGAEIVVGTPGRMIDLVKIKATNLQRVTYLVLDEADRMFDMGFEAQVRSICNHVRPDRQTLLFSATFKKKIERLARDVLTDPIRIVQGDVGEANTDVTQIVIVVPSVAGSKFNWLMNHLVEFQSRGSLLIFVTMKTNAEELANNLKLKEVEVLLLHGDMDQTDRNKVITQFKKKVVNVLVATDVAARGLDIPHIRTVVNYDVARDIDTHTHRIGRTGRAGEKGTAYTLVTDKDKEFAGHLVRNLEGANQEVPNALLDLAMQSSWFHKSRYKSGKGKNVNVGGRGLGYRHKSGLKSSENSSAGAVNVFPKVPRTGPGTDRLSALKAAFLSQYQNQFIASSDHTWEQIRSQPGFLPPSPPSSQSLEQTRCQAEFLLPTLPPPRSMQQLSQPSQLSLQETNQCSAQRKKKKSRWDTTEDSC